MGYTQQSHTHSDPETIINLSFIGRNLHIITVEQTQQSPLHNNPKTITNPIITTKQTQQSPFHIDPKTISNLLFIRQNLHIITTEPIYHHLSHSSNGTYISSFGKPPLNHQPHDENFHNRCRHTPKLTRLFGLPKGTYKQ